MLSIMARAPEWTQLSRRVQREGEEEPGSRGRNLLWPTNICGDGPSPLPTPSCFCAPGA
jgi:hypothetical protein